LAVIPAALATGKMELIEIANAEIEQDSRMEQRRNKRGELRGIVWRERNKERLTVWYVGARSKGQRKQQYDELKSAFETTANAEKNELGRGNDTQTSVGSGLDWIAGVGNQQTAGYIQ
jgi:hypothetical protein